jgi:hypothetical protein
MLRKIAPVLIASVLLASCAVGWAKDGAVQADLDRDLARCKQEWSRDRCMEAAGWKKVRLWL